MEAQALISPSYHIRNMVGNLWNNYLAGVNPFQYAKAVDVQKNPKKYADIVEEMKKVGVLDEGWYAKDIGEEVVDRVSGIKNWKKGINPLSMQNYVFKGNTIISNSSNLPQNSSTLVISSYPVPILSSDNLGNGF